MSNNANRDKEVFTVAYNGSHPETAEFPPVIVERVLKDDSSLSLEEWLDTPSGSIQNSPSGVENFAAYQTVVSRDNVSVEHVGNDIVYDHEGAVRFASYYRDDEGRETVQPQRAVGYKSHEVKYGMSKKTLIFTIMVLVFALGYMHFMNMSW